MNNQQKFEEWLANRFGEENGTKSSYLKALDMISKKTNKNIYSTKNLQEINILYQDLLKEQRIPNGKYFDTESPSYGKKGFYSAAVKNYISFFQDKNCEQE
ncbi:MAG: hypothetical protein ACQEWG_07575 [Bacteroidota bacterium]